MSAVSDGLALADPSTRTEARGLTESSQRPADILSRGVYPGTEVALDITIAAQDAKAAGTDACVSAYRRKMTKYSHLLPALRRAGVIFRPMVWSAEGRPHPETTRMIKSAVRLVKSRKGAEAATELQGRWEHEIAVAIQRRKAAMIRSVLPANRSRQQWLQSGFADRAVRLPTLEEMVEGADDREAAKQQEVQR